MYGTNRGIQKIFFVDKTKIHSFLECEAYRYLFVADNPTFDLKVSPDYCQ